MVVIVIIVRWLLNRVYCVHIDYYLNEALSAQCFCLIQMETDRGQKRSDTSRPMVKKGLQV